MIICFKDKENIVFLDISQENLPPDFDSKVFDMYSDWPDFREQEFDLIIFPESTLLNARFSNDKDRQDGLYHLIKQGLSVLSPNGEIRINGHSQLEEKINDVIQMVRDGGVHVDVSHDDSLIVVRKLIVKSKD